MLIKSQSLVGYELEGRDGGFGNVKEFYFDELHWTIRYLVADTGFWLTGRHTLISPYAIGAVSDAEQTIAIKLTKNQMEQSPSLNSDEPVSRQFEEDYYGFYGWPPYWGGPFMWGSYPYIVGNPLLLMMRSPDAHRKGVGAQGEGDPHLRSTGHVRGYHVDGKDGEIGHVDDFMIDDETWAIRYLVIGRRNWWPGKRILIATNWIESVSWDESKVYVNLSQNSVKTAPEYKGDLLLGMDYERALHTHYDRDGYWVGDEAAKAQLR